MVLVLEDSKDAAELIKEMLHSLGYASFVCLTGKNIIEDLRDKGKEFYGVAIFDIDNYYGMGGVETFEFLKQNDIPCPPVIISSGDPTHKEMVDPKKYGFVASLPKPAEVQKLVGALKEALG